MTSKHKITATEDADSLIEWLPEVETVDGDPSGFIYHAYAVNKFTKVKDREGRYARFVDAEMGAESYANMLNSLLGD